jgi:hypothetical protein
MTARELDEAAAEIRRRRRNALDCAIAAVGAAAIVPALLVLSGALAVSSAIGAALLAIRACVALARRRGLLERLVLDSAAQGIPEVEAFGARLVEPHARTRLARSIRSMLNDAFRPASRMHCLFLVDRVVAYARELEAIARDLCSPSVRVDPVSAARCHWLLTQAAENPLYDRALPSEQLGAILRAIRSGMVPVSRPVHPM